MATYKISRNIEASVIQKLESILEDNNWKNVSVVKGFQNSYKEKLPVIAVRAGDTEHLPIEIGTFSTKREIQLFIDIFATSEGQMLDLLDTLITIKRGMSYYQYSIENGKITDKEKKGNIRIRNISHEIVNLGVDNKADLHVHDRHRGLITGTAEISIVES